MTLFCAAPSICAPTATVVGNLMLARTRGLPSDAATVLAALGAPHALHQTVFGGRLIDGL